MIISQQQKTRLKRSKVKNRVFDKPFHIAFTEWGLRGGNHMSTLAGALHFNTFLRHADYVKRANYTMFISLLSMGEDGETYKSPFFHMYKLYSINVNGKSLDTYVDCETFDGEIYKNIPWLDVSASWSEDDKRIVINVVNRNMEKLISTDIISDTGEFKGIATVKTINSNEVIARYTSANKENYSPVTSTVKTKGKSFNYSFPAHSFTQIIAEIK